jgi:dihydroflavonol-4-reductase
VFYQGGSELTVRPGPSAILGWMPKTLVTGATGFIGSHLVRALATRGDELKLLIRTDSSADHLAPLEFDRVNGDVTDRRAVRRAVEGADRVFHVAGSTSMRKGRGPRVLEVNVGGTRLVCEEALAAGVERLVFTSSASALGPAPPRGKADETQDFPAVARGIPYVHSKHEAEAEALRVAAHGLDVVIVNPTFVLGPEDPKGTSMDLVRRFLLRQIPMYVDGGLNVSDVRDVSSGHVLADEKGVPGERYILAGRNFSLQRLFADLSRISGVPAPALKVPASAAVAAAEAVERFDLPLAISVDETRSAAMWWTYSGAKAKRELGYEPRSHEETLTDAVDWQAAQLGDRVGGEPGIAGAALDAVGRAARLAGRLAGG